MFAGRHCFLKKFLFVLFFKKRILRVVVSCLLAEEALIDRLAVTAPQLWPRPPFQPNQSNFAAHSTSPLSQGSEYKDARETVRRLGWQPPGLSKDPPIQVRSCCHINFPYIFNLLSLFCSFQSENHFSRCRALSELSPFQQISWWDKISPSLNLTSSDHQSREYL